MVSLSQRDRRFRILEIYNGSAPYNALLEFFQIVQESLPEGELKKLERISFMADVSETLGVYGRPESRRAWLGEAVRSNHSSSSSPPSVEAL